MNVLEVKGLKTQFQTREGVVRAVDDVSLHVDQGEILAIVGESGSGKSCTMLSIMRLIQQPPGKIVAGEVLFGGRNLMDLSEREMRSVADHQDQRAELILLARQRDDVFDIRQHRIGLL